MPPGSAVATLGLTVEPPGTTPRRRQVHHARDSHAAPASGAQPAGRFRRIAVKTARKGLRLRTRSGYYATAGTTPTIAAFELPLLAAIGAAPPPRYVTLRLNLKY